MATPEEIAALEQKYAEAQSHYEAVRKSYSSGGSFLTGASAQSQRQQEIAAFDEIERVGNLLDAARGPYVPPVEPAPVIPSRVVSSAPAQTFPYNPGGSGYEVTRTVGADGVEDVTVLNGTDVNTTVSTGADPFLGAIDANVADQFDFENLEFAGQDAQGNDILNVLPSSLNYNADPQPVDKYWEDWRVRLSLGRSAKILYNTEDPNDAGILFPLRETNGIIFPYTPQIAIQYTANYENYDLVHSNYRGYFYKNSAVQNILLTATFTAQDTQEANYMLASLHFLRSCTKMFYGQDVQRGMPPPVVFLHGLGEYHFRDHPCVVTMVTYNLPNDVDYIPAGVPTTNVPTNLYQQGTSAHSGHMSWSAKISRLLGAGLREGGSKGASVQPSNAPTSSPQDLAQLTKIYEGKTYVPSKIDINFTMLPIQTREQVSKEFSLKDYANGRLLKKGYW